MSADEIAKEREAREDSFSKSAVLAIIAGILLERHVTNKTKKGPSDKIEHGYLTTTQNTIDSAVRLAQRILLEVEDAHSLQYCQDACNSPKYSPRESCAGACVRVMGHEDSGEVDAKEHKCEEGHKWLERDD